MHVGILGGTGPAGSGLAARLASVGVEVTIGSRSAERAQQTCATVKQRWPDLDLALDGADNEAASQAELVVVATPWDAVTSMAAALADHLEDKVVISMANAIAMVGTELQPLIPPRGSMAGALQAVLPTSLVAGAFHHLPARSLAALDHPVDSDVMICSDHLAAIQATSNLVELVPDLRPIDAGSLSSAAAIEAFTAVLLQVNRRYRSHATIRLRGVKTGAKGVGGGLAGVETEGHQ